MPDATISVLIVDDHEVMRQSLSLYLEYEPGLSVWGTAESGADALAQLAAAGAPEGPDVVVADVEMPGMSGIELAGQIRGLYPRLPCLMHSAHVGLTYVEQARAAGASGYVVKGHPERIAEAIRRAVDAPGWIPHDATDEAPS